MSAHFFVRDEKRVARRNNEKSSKSCHLREGYADGLLIISLFMDDSFAEKGRKSLEIIANYSTIWVGSFFSGHTFGLSGGL